MKVSVVFLGLALLVACSPARAAEVNKTEEKKLEIQLPMLLCEKISKNNVKYFPEKGHIKLCNECPSCKVHGDIIDTHVLCLLIIAAKDQPPILAKSHHKHVKKTRWICPKLPAQLIPTLSYTAFTVIGMVFSVPTIVTTFISTTTTVTAGITNLIGAVATEIFNIGAEYSYTESAKFQIGIEDNIIKAKRDIKTFYGEIAAVLFAEYLTNLGEIKQHKDDIDDLKIIKKDDLAEYLLGKDAKELDKYLVHTIGKTRISITDTEKIIRKTQYLHKKLMKYLKKDADNIIRPLEEVGILVTDKHAKKILFAYIFGNKKNPLLMNEIWDYIKHNNLKNIVAENFFKYR